MRASVNVFEYYSCNEVFVRYIDCLALTVLVMRIGPKRGLSAGQGPPRRKGKKDCLGAITAVCCRHEERTQLVAQRRSASTAEVRVGVRSSAAVGRPALGCLRGDGQRSASDAGLPRTDPTLSAVFERTKLRRKNVFLFVGRRLSVTFCVTEKFTPLIWCNFKRTYEPISIILWHKCC